MIVSARRAVLIFRSLRLKIMIAMVALALAGAWYGPSCVAAAGEPAVAADLMIEHVNVLPMTEPGAVLRDVTVVISRGRIVAIGPSAALRSGYSSRRIDAAGMWLTPALADMHVHFENHRLLRLWLQDERIPESSVELKSLVAPYVANGVLQIANMSAMSESIGQRVEIDSGRVLGPHMFLGAMIDGAPSDWPAGMTRIAASASDGRQAVRDAIAEGYDFIKTYNRLSLPAFTAVVDEARQQRMKVAGHLPLRGEAMTERLLRPGFGLAAHLQEYSQQVPELTDARIDQFVRLTRTNGTWVVSTLSADQIIARILRDPGAISRWPQHEFVHPLIRRYWQESALLKDRSSQRVARFERIADDSARVMRALMKAGVPILAGTDLPLPLQAPGFALHDELDALVAAGMTTESALWSATRLPATWMGVLHDRGTVEAGKRADLILLAGNPLVDIANSRRIVAVIASGRYLRRAELNRMLSDTARHYRSTLPVNSSVGLRSADLQ